MKQVTKDVLQIPVMPRNAINCYLVEDSLIDAGIKGAFNKIKNSVSGRDINSHVLTHAHADHQGSSAQICSTFNIPLWCSELEKPQAESGNATSEYPAQNHLITRFQKKYWAGTGYPVSKELRENDFVGSFRVIETPGHSSGHLSFFRESDGVLIVGDVVTNMNLLTTIEGLHLPPNLFTTDREENIKSLKKLASLNPKILCFGHGPVLINNKMQFENFANKF